MSARRSSVVALLALSSALAITAVAVASPRSEIATKRRQAQAAQAAVEQLGVKLESAVNRYNTAQARLAVVQRTLRENERAITIVRHNVEVSQTTLANQLALAYRRGDVDVASALLTATSIEQLLSTVDVVRRADAHLASVITTLASARRDLDARQRRLTSDRQTAATLVHQAAAARAQITAGIAAQRRLVQGLQGEIAQLQREEQARQARLAADARQRVAAARAAAAAAAAARPDPGIGGSGGTGSRGGGGGIVAPPSDGSIGARVVSAAMRWLGTPYAWGGGNASGPTHGIDYGAGTIGFDCSGLTLYAYATVGIRLDHYTGSQWNAGTRISRISDLAIGDLVFFGSDLGHEGIYIGAGQFIHAPHTGDVVKISSLSGYYAAEFQGGVRPY